MMRPKLAPRRKVIAHQRILFAQEQLTVDDDRMRPGFADLDFRLETAFQFVFLRRCFNQRDLTALISEDDMPIDTGHRRGTATGTANLATPFHLTLHLVDSYGKSIVVTMAEVEVITEQH